MYFYMVASVAGLGIPVLAGMVTNLHTTLIYHIETHQKGYMPMTIPSQHTRDPMHFYMVGLEGNAPS